MTFLQEVTQGMPVEQKAAWSHNMHVCLRQMFTSMSLLVHAIVLIGAKEDFAALRNFMLAGDGSRRGVLRFPEICTMELHLLATGSPDLEVLNHVFHSLLAAVHANQRNAALLYDQVRWTTSSSFILIVLITNVSLHFNDFTCSCLPREELKLSCLAFTVFSATPTRPLLVCYFIFFSFTVSSRMTSFI